MQQLSDNTPHLAYKVVSYAVNISFVVCKKFLGFVRRLYFTVCTAAPELTYIQKKMAAEEAMETDQNSVIDPDTQKRLAEEKKEEGNQLYKVKSYREALHKYSEAIDLCPQCAAYYGNRSACYMMLGQPKQALEDARTSTSIDPSFVKGWARVAKCCIMLGDTVTARQAINRVAELGGSGVDLEQRNAELIEKYEGESQQAYNNKDFRKALYCLDKSLEIANYSVRTKTARAECLAFLGRYPEAQEAANSILQFDTMNADAIYVRGLCLYYEDNVDRAFTHFTQVLRLAPDHIKAKEIYRKAKSLKTKKEEGNVAFKAGHLTQAYKLYSEALEIDPLNKSTNAKLYFNRATVAAKLSKVKDCIEDCSRAIDLDNNYTKAVLRRAKCYMETEQYEEAVRDYEKVANTDKHNREYSCQRSAGRMLGRGRSASIVLVVLIFGLLVTAVNIYQLHKMQAMHFQTEHGPYPEGRPGTDTGQMYVVYAKHPDSGYLKHVYNVLERAGYRRGNYNSTDLWDVMWAHDYPFKKIRSIMEKMRPGQKVNKFPGSGYITNKVNLATSGIPNVPPAFKMPKEKDKLLDYVKSNPDKMFVQKSNNHRGIKIEKIDDLDLDSDGSFVQEFIHNPLLVDGYKFDIGLYVTLTSVDPLRVHVHQSDALLRFCPEKYHPFDQKNKDKYVVNDDYLPLWKVPSLSKHYNDLGFSFKDTLNAHIKSLGKDPEAMWDQMYSTIVEVYRSQEDRFVKAASHYPHKSAFFEMVRFDFVIDSDLNVYLMEANMSPNLSSAHFPPNQLLYEQVVHSVLRLVGVISGSIQADLLHPPSKDALDMLVHEKDLYVFPETCATEECSSSSSCSRRKCELCKHCLRKADLEMLRGAWVEGASQFATRRIFPPPVGSREEASKEGRNYEGMSDSNRKMHEWYRGKCIMDRSWCNK